MNMFGKKMIFMHGLKSAILAFLKNCQNCKADKWDYLKKGSCDFKNSFYFRMEKVPSIPGMCQKLRLVIRPFRSRSKQCTRVPERQV